MNTAQILFVWLISGIGFGVGAGSIEESSPRGRRLIAGFITAILFGALAYQIIA